jgi:hypothetical protein
LFDEERYAFEVHDVPYWSGEMAYGYVSVIDIALKNELSVERDHIIIAFERFAFGDRHHQGNQGLLAKPTLAELFPASEALKECF